MHEMSYIVQIVNTTAMEAVGAHATKAVSLTIEVGQMTGLETHYLKKYYKEAIKGTILDGSRLTVIPVRVFAECKKCGKHYHPGRSNDYLCPVCGSADSVITSGREFNIRNLTIE